MKKLMTLLLVMVLLLSYTPALAVDWKYESRLLGTSIYLPDYLEVFAEFKGKEKDTVYIYFSFPETNAQIVATLSYVPEYEGKQTKDVPKKDIERWKKIFTENYPKRCKSTLIKPTYSSKQRIYRFYGLSNDGYWMLNYTGVKDGLYVAVCCETGKFGYTRSEMYAIFEVFNDCFQLFAKSRGVDFVRFSPDDFEVQIFNLLYDDSPSSPFRSY